MLLRMKSRRDYQMAARNDSRARKVADRLCHKLKHRGGGYVCDSATSERPIRIMTAHRVISVYFSGLIEQSLTAHNDYYDPHSACADFNRVHVMMLENAAHFRRRGEYESAHLSLNRARTCRLGGERARVRYYAEAAE